MLDTKFLCLIQSGLSILKDPSSRNTTSPGTLHVNPGEKQEKYTKAYFYGNNHGQLDKKNQSTFYAGEERYFIKTNNKTKLCYNGFIL